MEKLQFGTQNDPHSVIHLNGNG